MPNSRKNQKKKKKTEIYGHDAFDFNPERFGYGTGGGHMSPYVYIPFGVRFWMCAGQNLAMVELKGTPAFNLTEFMCTK